MPIRRRIMKNGKVSEAILKRSVLRQLHSRNDNVIKGPGIAEDAGILSVAGNVAVSTNSVSFDFGDTKLLADLAVNRGVNGVAAEGATPLAITTDLLIPTTWNEAWVKELVKEIDAQCDRLDVAVINGHTQVTRAVNTPVVSVTALGDISKDNVIDNSRIKPGMDVIMTGFAGIFGTAVLAAEKCADLRSRYSQPFIDRAAGYLKYISVVKEAAAAVNAGVSGLHDVSEGGIFAALWELAQAANVGLDIQTKDIPIKQETVEICEFFDINPYKLISTGSLLIVAADGNSVVREIEKAGGCASIIGVTTDSNDRVLIQGEERRFLETAQADELYKIYQM